MFIMQVLGLSRRRCGKLIDMTIMVELASRIQNLPHNESNELLAHGVNRIGFINFLLNLPHLSCWEKNLVILFHRISIIRRTCHECLYILLDPSLS